MHPFGPIWKDPHARCIPFDNSSNGFTSANVQDAIEEAKDTADSARYTITLTHNGTVGDGTFYGYSNLIPGDDSPIVIVRDSTFKDFSFTNNNSSADFTLEFRKNSLVAAPFASFTKVNTQFFSEIDIDESFSAGDIIYVKHVDNGGNAADVGIVLYFLNTGT